MNQVDLYEMISSEGGAIVQFSDYPAFFGCWSLVFKKKGQTYTLEHEGRDGWLLFYSGRSGQDFKELDRKESTRMDEAQQVLACKEWIASV